MTQPFSKIMQALGKHSYCLVPALICFVVVTFFHFRVLNSRAVFFADSAGYLVSATEIRAALMALLTFDFSQAWSVLSARPFVERFLIDGPVIPIWGALTFAIVGKAPNSFAWPVIIFALGLLNALVALITAALVKIALRSKIAGFGAGLAWAFYPGAAYASGRYLTEPLTVFYIVASLAVGCALISNSNNSNSKTGLRLILCAVQGLLSGSGILLKPALLPLFACLTFIPIILSQPWEKKFSLSQFKSALVALVGFASAPLAWATYTKFAEGHIYFFPQRVPLLNIVVGHDLETDGWCAITNTPTFCTLTGLGNSVAVLLYSWQHNFAETAELYLRKIPRIVGFVWNDFKQPFYGVTLVQQNFVHSVLVALAAFGAVIFCFQFNSLRKEKPVLFYLLAASILTIGSHIVMYMPFESCPRYGYPSMPCFVILAAYGLHCALSQSTRSKSYFCLASLLCTAVLINLNLTAFFAGSIDFTAAVFISTAIKVLAITAASVYCCKLAASLAASLPASLPAADARSEQGNKYSWLVSLSALLLLVLLPTYLSSTKIDEWRETSISLPLGAHIERVANLPEAALKPQSTMFYVLVDSNSPALKCKINGVEMAGNFVPIASHDLSLEKYVGLGRMLSFVTDRPLASFRQWRVLELPRASLKAGANTIEMAATTGDVKIFADRVGENEKSYRLPSRSLYSYSKAIGTGYEMDPRLMDGVGQTLNSENHPTSVCARVFLMASKPAPGTTPAQPAAGKNEGQSATLDFASPLFDLVMHLPGSNADEISVNRYTVKDARTAGVTLKLPAWCTLADQFKLHLSGEVRPTGKTRDTGILAIVYGPSGVTLNSTLPSPAPYFHTGDGWTKFDFTDFLYNKSHNIDQATVVLFPGRAEQIMQYGLDQHIGSFLFRNVKLTLTEIKPTDLSTCESKLY